MAYQPTHAQASIYDFVKNGTGNGIIDAVAGAGKTTTLIGCVDYLPKLHDVLYCAFNTSIRKEIQKKFHNHGKSVAVKTIHSLGFHIIRHSIKAQIVIDKYKTIMEDPEFFESLIPEINGILSINHFLSVQGIRSLQKRTDLEWEEKNALNESSKFVGKIEIRLRDINDKYRLTLCDNTFEAYREMVDHFSIFEEDGCSDDELRLFMSAHQKLLKEGNSIAASHGYIDFTDQLYLPYALNLSSKVQYGFVFVDECQDLSKAQLEVVKKYVRPGGRVLAVGDPYQSIYGFAGADSQSFWRVKDSFSCTPLSLTDCFRCPADVIKLAQTIREDINGFKTEPDIVAKIDNNEVMMNLRPGDLVLCRFRAPLLALAMKLVNKDVKIHLHPDEVKEFIGDYKAYFRPAELKKSITDETIDSFFEKIRERNEKKIIKDNANVDFIIRSFRIKEAMSLLDESLKFFRKNYLDWQLNTIDSILVRLKKTLSYLGDDAIKISTIHRAKGLENDRVFILEYNKLPVSREQAWETEQERNLHYVAVTRPKKELYLCMEKREEDEVDKTEPSSEQPDFELNPPFDIDGDSVNSPAPVTPLTPAEIASLQKQNHIKILSTVKTSKIPDRFYSLGHSEDTPYSALNSREFQKVKYWAITAALQDTEYAILNVISSNYNDAYVIIGPDGERIYDGHYKGTGMFTFVPRGTYADNEILMAYLNDEASYPISFEYNPQNKGFEAADALIKAGCFELGILNTNVFREGYNMVYCLKTKNSYAYIKLTFNGRNIITTLQPFSTIGSEDEDVNKLLDIMNSLWQK